eukprot:scaffold32475_cov27-Tisochrysis_lutea.AAC.1
MPVADPRRGWAGLVVEPSLCTLFLFAMDTQLSVGVETNSVGVVPSVRGGCRFCGWHRCDDPLSFIINIMMDLRLACVLRERANFEIAPRCSCCVELCALNLLL